MSGLVPGWGTLEKIVNLLRDTGAVGQAFIMVIYHESPSFRVNSSIGLEAKLPVTGAICAPDKPFTLQANGNNPNGAPHVGEFAFTPAGTSGGSWKYSATSCTTLQCGTVTACNAICRMPAATTTTFLG